MGYLVIYPSTKLNINYYWVQHPLTVTFTHFTMHEMFQMYLTKST